jgi:hypothetical protein
MKDEKQSLVAPEGLPHTESFTGEKTIVEELASRIMTCWHRTTEGILELARVCANADQQLAGPAKHALIAKLPFDRATFSKLVKIGNDPRLATIAPRLPQSFSTLYELSKFADVQFDAAIKSGAVHPAVTRSEILELAAEGSSGESKKTAEQIKSSLPALKLLWAKATDADRKQFIEWCVNNA